MNIVMKLLTNFLLRDYHAAIAEISRTNVKRFSRGNVVVQLGRIRNANRQLERSLLADSALKRLQNSA